MLHIIYHFCQKNIYISFNVIYLYYNTILHLSNIYQDSAIVSIVCHKTQDMKKVIMLFIIYTLITHLSYL